MLIKKPSNRVVPILLFSLSPCLPSLFQKPRHSVCTTGNFSTVFDRKGRGGGRGGEKLFPLIKAVRIMLSKLAKQSFDIVSGQLHCAATSILLLKKNLDVHVNWPPLRDSPDNLSSIVPSSELTQNVSLRTSQRWPISIFNRQ